MNSSEDADFCRDLVKILASSQRDFTMFLSKNHAPEIGTTSSNCENLAKDCFFIISRSDK